MSMDFLEELKLSNEIKETINSVIRKFETIYKQDKFESLIDEKKELIIDSELKELTNDLFDVATINVDVLKILENLKEQFPHQFFWDLYNEHLDLFLAPFNDTMFIRELSLDTQKAFFKEIIENQFLYSYEAEDSAQNLNQLYNISISTEEIEIGYSVILMLQAFVISRRYPKKRFIISTNQIFRFEEELIEYIWGWFEGNKTSFFQHYLLRRLQLVQDKLDSFE